MNEALIERIAEVLKPYFVSAGLVDLDAEDYAWDAAKELTDGLVIPDYYTDPYPESEWAE